MATEEAIDERMLPDPWPVRWGRIVGAGVLLILLGYLMAALAVVPYLTGNIYLLLRLELSDRATLILLGAALVHLLGNVLITLDPERRPTSLLRFGRDFVLFMALPALPVIGLIMPFEGISILARMIGFPPIDPHWLCAAAFICPVATFFRLRVLARQLGDGRLGEWTALVAIGDPIAVAVMLSAGYLFRFFHRDGFGWSAAFLVPPVLLMLFTLGSLYVLFEMAGLLFESARQAEKERQAWMALHPARS